MKQFFKFMFASMLGTILSGVLLIFLFFAIAAGIVAASMSDLQNKDKMVNVKENSILKLDLNQMEHHQGHKSADIEIDLGPFGQPGSIGVNTIVENLEKAAKDDRIKGIYLKSTFPIAGYANLSEIRDALTAFKESGKWILTYDEIYGQAGYYLASVADEIYLFPEGVTEISGFSANLMFFKNMLEKIGVEAQVIRGKNNKFKSAVEPFLNTEMSEANKKQTLGYIGDRWEIVKGQIAASRGLQPSDIDFIADNLSSRNAQGAKESGLIDAIVYEDEFLSILAEKVGAKNIDDINFVELSKYKNAKLPDYKRNTAKDEIAIIYANGEINSGKSDENSIGSQTFATTIRDLRLDDDVKGAVLRINSPGGSALASEVIWRELVLLAAEKPLVVSMGNVAASGGYYIATPAAKIYANANTITGSIGVFGILPNFKKLATEKIGLSFDGVKTNKFSDLGNLSRGLTTEEYNIIQGQVEQTYSTFLQRVADGRKLSVNFVDSIGQGRVWSGVDALEIGLVDELGDIEDAIAEVAKMAELESYKTKGYPKIKDPIQKLLEELNVETVSMKIAESYISEPELINAFREIEKIKSLKGVQMRLPFIVE